MTHFFKHKSLMHESKVILLSFESAYIFNMYVWIFRKYKRKSSFWTPETSERTLNNFLLRNLVSACMRSIFQIFTNLLFCVQRKAHQVNDRFSQPMHSIKVILKMHAYFSLLNNENKATLDNSNDGNFHSFAALTSHEILSAQHKQKLE